VEKYVSHCNIVYNKASVKCRRRDVIALFDTVHGTAQEHRTKKNTWNAFFCTSFLSALVHESSVYVVFFTIFFMSRLNSSLSLGEVVFKSLHGHFVVWLERRFQGLPSVLLHLGRNLALVSLGQLINQHRRQDVLTRNDPHNVAVCVDNGHVPHAVARKKLYTGAAYESS